MNFSAPRLFEVSQAVVAVPAFAPLQWWKLPPWLVVLLAAAAGQWLLP